MDTKKRLLALNLVLVLLLTLVPSAALADEVGVAVDALNFPDYAFREYISANCDTDGNRFLSAAEIANVTEIYVSGQGIASLEGLKYFAALSRLDCAANSLGSLPEMPSSLTYLDCSGNELTEIKLNPTACYDYIDVRYNQLPNREAVTGQVIDWTKDGFYFGIQNHEHVFEKLATEGIYIHQRCVNCEYSGLDTCTHEDGAALDENGVCSVCGALVTSIDANGEFRYIKADDKEQLVCVEFGQMQRGTYYTEVSDNIGREGIKQFATQEELVLASQEMLKLYYRDSKTAVFSPCQGASPKLGFTANEPGEYSVKVKPVETINITQSGTYSYDSDPFYLIDVSTSEPHCIRLTFSDDIDFVQDCGYLGRQDGNEVFIDLAGGSRRLQMIIKSDGTAGSITASYEDHDLQLVSHSEPNCEEFGHTEYNCSKCNANVSEYAEPLGHNFAENEVCTRCGKYLCEVNTDPAKHIYDENGVCTRCGLAIPEPLTLENGARYSLSADGVFSVYYPFYDYDDTEMVKDYFDHHLQNVRKVVYEEGTLWASNYQPQNVEEIYLSSTVRAGFPTDLLYAPLLQQITVADNNSYYCSVDGVLYSKDMKTLLHYPDGRKAEQFDIPYGVTEISCNAFEFCQLEYVYMPDSVTDVGTDAFYSSEKLRSVRLSNNVTKLDSTFRFCKSLESVVIPDSVTEMTWVFHGCDNLKNVKLPENLKIFDHNFELFVTKKPDICELYLPASLELMADEFYGFEDFRLYYGGTEQQWNELMEKTREIIGAGFEVDKNVTVLFLDDAKTVESGSDSGIGVSVTPIGDETIGENVKLAVSGAEMEDASLIIKQTGSDKFAAYDISLIDEAGNESQIESGYALVKLTVPEGFDASNCAVYRVEEDGTLTDMGAAFVDGKLQFATEHFSTYVVVEKSGCMHYNMKAEVISASCTANGYTIYTCPDCGFSRTGAEIAATGHKTELANAKEATCTEAGYTGDEVCTVCGETIEQGKVIEATGHHYDGKVCTDCGHKMSAGESVKMWFSDTIQNIKSFFDKIFGRH